MGHRVAKLEGRIEGYSETARNQSQRIDTWIERIVKVEMAQKTKRRKAS